MQDIAKLNNIIYTNGLHIASSYLRNVFVSTDKRNSQMHSHEIFLLFFCHSLTCLYKCAGRFIRGRKNPLLSRAFHKVQIGFDIAMKFFRQDIFHFIFLCIISDER